MTAIAEILSLPVKERLNCMEELWSSLKDEDVESPEWHREILDARKQSVENGDAKLLSLDELKDRLSSRKG